MPESTPNQPVVYTLSNGARYVRLYVPGAETVKVQVILSVGSRDETPETAGYAHCLEHFFFKGAKGYPNSFALDNAIERIGGRTNAFTSEEQVAYYGIGLKKYVRGLARVITTMVTQPTFPAGEWEHERHTVISELASRAAKPNGWLWDELYDVAFGGNQPSAWSAGGLIPVVKNAQAADLEEYFRANYDPSRMTVVIGGGATLAPEDVDKLVAHMPNGHMKPRVPAVWGQGKVFKGKAMEAPAGSQQVQMILALPGVQLGRDAAGENRELAFELLTEVLSGTYSSPMQSLVRSNPHLVSGLGAHSIARDDLGVFTLSLSTTPQMQEKAAATAVEMLREVAFNGVSAADLVRAKTSATAELARETEDELDQVSYYADRAANGKELITPQELARRVEAVSAQEVQQVAEELISQLAQIRFLFIHPCNLATGRNSRGQTMEQAGRSIWTGAVSGLQSLHFDREIA